MYGHRFAGAMSLMGHMRTQHSDEPKALTKRKEMVLYQELQKAGVQFEYQCHIPFRGCGLNSETTCAYVDFVTQSPGDISYWSVTKISIARMILLVT